MEGQITGAKHKVNEANDYVTQCEAALEKAEQALSKANDKETNARDNLDELNEAYEQQLNKKQEGEDDCELGHEGQRLNPSDPAYHAEAMLKSFGEDPPEQLHGHIQGIRAFVEQDRQRKQQQELEVAAKRARDKEEANWEKSHKPKAAKKEDKGSGNPPTKEGENSDPSHAADHSRSGRRSRSPRRDEDLAKAKAEATKSGKAELAKAIKKWQQDEPKDDATEEEKEAWKAKDPILGLDSEMQEL